MSKQIIKQPNGKYCIFDPYFVEIVAKNCDKKKLINTLLLEYLPKVNNEVVIKLHQLEKEDNPIMYPDSSYDKLMKQIENVKGMREAKRINKIMRK